ncbi:MAG: hypothetical protein N4A70_15670 [Pelagimonas sp.]|jgi:hypothetical protein|nr:hypothetical protein [Pelagimonas sp.]
MRFLLLCLLIWTAPAQAHPLTGAKSREIHVQVDPDDGEIMVLLRFPLSFAFASALAGQTDEEIQSAFLTTEGVSGSVVYRLNQSAYEDDYEGFTQVLLKDYRFEARGQVIEPIIGAVSLISGKDVVMPGAGLISSQALLDMCAEVPGKDYIGDVEVAMQLYLTDIFPADTLKIAVTTPPVPLPSTLAFNTHVIDHRSTPPVVITHAGFLPPAIKLTGRNSQLLGDWYRLAWLLIPILGIGFWIRRIRQE